MKFVNVWKEYRRSDIVIHALRDVSVHINQGDFCALMGPSGSGKSTFLNVIAGLDQITSGDIFLEGESTAGFSDADWTNRRREFIGMVFQAFHLVPGLTAAENVGLPLLLSGKAPSMVRQRVAENLEMVGMQHRAQHRPADLSGGEQQRVAIARAVVHQPRLVLADEPTGNLDSHNAAEVVVLLRRISRDWGQTVILATHSEAAAREADRRYLLRDGEMAVPFGARPAS